MKNFFLFLLVATVFVACKDDDNNDNNNTVDPLEGSWNMISYNENPMPEVPVFNAEDVVWTFNPENGVVTIVNNIEDLYPFIPTSGSMSYSINTEEMVTIGGTSYRYSVSASSLNLNSNTDPNGGTDGPVMGFNR